MPFQIIVTERGILCGFFDDLILCAADDWTTAIRRISHSSYRGGTANGAQRVDIVFPGQDAGAQALSSDDFEIYNLSEEIARSARTQDTLATLLGAIAAISLLTGCIGVTNVMLMTVKSAGANIGIHIAIGACIATF